MSKGSANRVRDWNAYRNSPLWNKPRTKVEPIVCPRCKQVMKSKRMEKYHEEMCISFLPLGDKT